MQQDKDYLKKMLDRYRLGRSEKKERSGIIAWLMRLDLLGEVPSETELQYEERRSLSELRATLQPAQKAKVIRFSLWIRTAAASILVLIALGIWRHQYLKNTLIPAARWAETTTANGEIKQVVLSDGTRVTLNSMTRLRYPVVFEGVQREVTLSGQAFFQVNHEVKRTFKVHARKLDVQVLGTSFDIRAYNDEPEIRVGVASGKVGVLAIGQTTQFLTRGQGLKFGLEKQLFVRYNADSSALGSWQQRRLVFKDQSLYAITRELRRYYNVQFVFANQLLKAKKLSLSIRNQDIGMIMKALAASGSFLYTIKNNTITLR